MNQISGIRENNINLNKNVTKCLDVLFKHTETFDAVGHAAMSDQ